MKGLRNAGKEGRSPTKSGMTSRRVRGDNGKGKWILAGACPEQGRMGKDDEEGGAGKTSRGKLAGTNSHKSFRLL